MRWIEVAAAAAEDQLPLELHRKGQKAYRP